jgi:hypothetical protein
MNASAFAMPPNTSQPRYVDQGATADERTYALFNHLTLVLFNAGIPLAAAIIMWIIKRKQSPFLDDHGREAVNFQISLLIYAIAIIPVVGLLTCAIGFILYVPLYVLGVYGCVMACIAANRGEYYRYPATIRLLS